MYKIKEEDIKTLTNYILEIPAKYANPIIDFLNKNLVKIEKEIKTKTKKD